MHVCRQKLVAVIHTTHTHAHTHTTRTHHTRTHARARAHTHTRTHTHTHTHLFPNRMPFPYPSSYKWSYTRLFSTCRFRLSVKVQMKCHLYLLKNNRGRRFGCTVYCEYLNRADRILRREIRSDTQWGLLTPGSKSCAACI